MKKQNLSLEELKKYFNGQKKHMCHTETVTQYNNLQRHAEGVLPGDLISKRRPGESTQVLEYRKQIYVPKTKNPITKVINSLSKIRRSPDWMISFSESDRPPSVIEKESLEAYCEKNLPGYQSITDWIFTIGLKEICIDANAVIAVFPKDMVKEDNEYWKPEPMLFNSANVLLFETGDTVAIIKSEEKSDIENNGKTEYGTGDVYYVFTDAEVSKYEQANGNRDFTRTQTISHNLGYLPVFKVPAPVLKKKNNSVIQESRLAPMVPHLDEAAREYSDLQASKVMHMYPLMWYFDTKECNHCTGTGKISGQTENGQPKTCSHCEGAGKVKFSPFRVLSVDPPKVGEAASTPTPPAGYVIRDVEIIKHQEESCKAHLYEALGSLNMQFLDQTPLVISGEAKNVDREELNNFVYSVAEDLVKTMDKIYKMICDWRYNVIIEDPELRSKMLPKIPVPQNFDLIPADYLMQDISSAKTAKVNPILIAAMEHDYAVKKFYTNPDVAVLTSLLFELDPMPALSDDEKMTRVQNSGVSQQDYVISSNLVTFLKVAISKDKDFAKKKYDEQMTVLKTMADEKIKELSKAEQLKLEMANPAGGPPDPNKDNPNPVDPNKPIPPVK
jgi:hypothetical protein